MTSAPDTPGLSRLQRFFIRWAGPETAAAMEAHSRAWLVRCPNCGHERSIWELGGIRYKATGHPRTRLRCPSCGEAGWHKISKAKDFPVTHAPMWPLVRVLIVLGLIVFAIIAVVGAVILGVVFKLTGLI